MGIGVVYPQTEFGSDPVAVCDYAQSVEGLGYSHIVAYDHVLGANPDRPGGWKGTYSHKDPFLEPFVLFSYLTGLTQKLEFVSGVIVLPQRQTALVAKQAATLDVLCGGRMRLGVGLGWNEVEYTALNENFHNRGRRIEEQVDVLRKLWTEPLVTYQGRWHTILDAGLNPLPVQRPIPIWFGGRVEDAIRRIARLANGWLVNTLSPVDARLLFDILHRELVANGRDPGAFPIEARLAYSQGPVAWPRLIQDWQALGATHFSVNTIGCGFRTPQEHIQAVRLFAETTGLTT
ncbi:MAG TPA: LLM class F420-dependent oxidoreductase [Anaerolineaceae bacterium]|nr:LLM class F420-dependent oxidoreductase [Anaerolineaceae bacterium]